MDQLTQELKFGQMEITEVPFPVLGKGQILVRNHYSAISAGTESKTVSDARKGYLAKAKSRQKEVKMVIDMIKSEGLKKTYDVVMNKLEALSPLGYSCAGEVIAISNDINDIKVGDCVACGGSGAYHAEVVSVTRNLCVKIKNNINLKHAAFAAIAAIAIQGIRQADLRFGENCTVIGLGLIGQLTIQLLDAAGIKSIAIDINERQVRVAKSCGADLALIRNEASLEAIIKDYTKGYGTDAVIITAATKSNDPVELAGELCRKKGRVIIVGSVSTDFTRKNYYQKELDLRMSSSYGPGRYDPQYEQKGIDYPIGYVRFTENRNMQTYIDLLEKNKLEIDKLITHTFDLHSAPAAYKMILDKSEYFSGILIKYDIEKEIIQKRMFHSPSYDKSEINVGLIGAGSFAQNSILPRIKDKCRLIGISTGSGNNSVYIAKKYEFSYSTNSPDEVISDSKINTIFILTRHNLHAENILKCIHAGKNIFVEKPLALDIEELEVIKNEYENSPVSPRLMLGFNRRFSPFIRRIKNEINDKIPKAITMRINAGQTPQEHWIQDPKIGGGRIIGEACHFIDLAMFITSSKIKSIYVNKLEIYPSTNDTVNISLGFENGSIANISYFSNGNKSLPKEYIEVFANNTVYIVHDFIKMDIFNKKKETIKLKSQDKGHSRELEEFLTAIKNGLPSPIPFNEIYLSSLATFKALESIKSSRTIDI